ncbi:MAG: hypothetical protein E5W86_17220 [Mesorhizobium sp.]|nr:MAG: hypothetical protein E5W86_17220 [Mesorhizobium sp.]
MEDHQRHKQAQPGERVGQPRHGKDPFRGETAPGAEAADDQDEVDKDGKSRQYQTVKQCPSAEIYRICGAVVSAYRMQEDQSRQRIDDDAQIKARIPANELNCPADDRPQVTDNQTALSHCPTPHRSALAYL